MQFCGLLLIISSWIAVTTTPPQDAPLISDPVGQWIPADSAMVVEISNAKQWSGNFGDNQLGQMLIRFSPANRFVRGWHRMQRMLGQTHDEMVDNYFGQSVVLVAAHTGTQSPMVIISKLRSRQVALDMIAKLQLELRENFEDHQIFQTPDGGAILSLHDTSPTIILTSEHNTPYLKRLILAARTEPLLKNDPAFLAFLASTPDDAVLKGYIRPADGEKHSFFITNHADAIQAQYVGKTPQITDILSRLGSNEPHQFGPLPANCIAALAVNLNAQNTKSIDLLDMLIAPKTYAKDLQPKLGKSVVFFFNKPEQKQMLPAVGIALQMKDQNLSSDLDTFMKNIMVVSSMTLGKKRTPQPGQNAPPVMPVQATLIKHNQTAYRTAQVANIKMVQHGLTIVTPIGLSWGRINDWYVVSSDKQTFCASIDNSCQKTPFMTSALNPVEEVPGTRIAQMLLKPQVLIDHLKRFAHDEPQTPKITSPRRSHRRQSPIELSDLCAALQQFSQMSVNVYRDDQNQMVAHIKINRIPTK